MAKNDLFKTLRKHGLRKRVARTVADAQGGGKQAERVVRDVLSDLDKAGAAIRDKAPSARSRSAAAKKAAATRRRKSAQRSAAGRRAAKTRKARAA
jgi:hypothetical protein